ncbi:hypothetical protein [Lysobacter sp. F60174L2]|uniref:hypothetical protein n=1 Tax=Lysobacter sp. F60174L2 TaxID=3459295 RepID=UPI00403D8E20
MSGIQMIALVHAGAGTIALASFWLAAALRKGSPRHRLAGRAYLLSMATVIVSGVPLVLESWFDGHPVTASFLGYLLVLVTTTVWLSWRAVRDRQQPQRYLGAAYRVLAWANPVAGAVVLVLGLVHGVPLLVGFSMIGLLTGVDMHRRRRLIAGRQRWWLEEHYRAMTANGAATHIAFFLLGLPRLLPGVGEGALAYVGWFAPVVLAVAVRFWLDRRYGQGAAPSAAPAPAAGRRVRA